MWSRIFKIVISKIRNLYGGILNISVSFTGCPKSPFTEIIFTFQENGTLFRN
jgi:hypothetical protein